MYTNYESYRCPCYNDGSMYRTNNIYHNCPYYTNTSFYNPYNMANHYVPYYSNEDLYATDFMRLDKGLTVSPTPQSNIPQIAPMNTTTTNQTSNFKDYGPEPFVIDIEEATIQNDTFRTALWTGEYLQLTLMSIPVGGDIGLEMHPDVDQFIRIEEGNGVTKMGDREDDLNFEEEVEDDFVLLIPAGKWHNLINTGDKPLKLYSLYAPPNHPFGTVHETQAMAQAAEENEEG